ncbi:MAG TPA: NADH-quinone oxidoreductase subunit C [Terriglobales bacterium]|nr:NADH-quinone oxidoreductase subunit C [Terriglobales bacterium]
MANPAIENLGPNAISDIDQLKSHPALAKLMGWKADAVESAKFDRNELSIYVKREFIREACALLKADFNFFCDVTCVDWFPTEPRFHISYHLLSHKLKERVRLKVRLDGDNAAVESITSVWPGANYFEREVFDLFGVRFLSHPDMRRLMMPQDWEGHPLRKDYPVEGYR